VLQVELEDLINAGFEAGSWKQNASKSDDVLISENERRKRRCNRISFSYSWSDRSWFIKGHVYYMTYNSLKYDEGFDRSMFNEDKKSCPYCPSIEDKITVLLIKRDIVYRTWRMENVKCMSMISTSLPADIEFTRKSITAFQQREVSSRVMQSNTTFPLTVETYLKTKVEGILQTNQRNDGLLKRRTKKTRKRFTIKRVFMP
jgi:hypothetical protein